MEQEGNHWLPLVYSGLVIFVLTVVSVIATRRLQKIPRTPGQGLIELIVSSLNNFVSGVIGPGGEKYTPFVGTIFIYVLCMNILGLIPGLKAPTSSLSITIPMALVVFVMYNYYGVREVGAVRYMKHLLGEPLWLAPLMLPIHIIGELARPLSLSIRLFGNIYGEETILVILAGMSLALRYHGIPVLALPYQFPMMLFAVFTSFVQAMVFAVLSAIYISIATSGHEEHGG